MPDSPANGADPDKALPADGRYEAIFRSAVDFAIIATDRDGRITDWNSGAERILGWAAGEILGQPADRFFVPEDRDADRPGTEMRQAIAAGRANDERWHLRRDGTRFWGQGEMMPLRGRDGVQLGFLKILRDRTAEREAAERQRADAEFLRSVLAASGDCIKVLDLDARLLFMTENGQRLMEVSDFNAIRGCSWPDFWQGPEYLEAEAAVAAARAGRVGQFRGLFDTMAGTRRSWDVQITPMFGTDGRPEKLLSVSRDVTATREAEEALRRSEAQWRELFGTLQEGFALAELVRDEGGQVVDWRYLDVNPAWSAMLGIPPGRAVGRTVRRLFPDARDRWMDELGTVVGTRKPKAFMRQVGPLGRWHEGRAFALQGDRFGMLFVDVSERRQAEERRLALLELDDRLRDMDDLAEMSRTAAEIMGRTVGVTSAGCGTIAANGKLLVVERDWTAAGVVSVAGRHEMRRYGSHVDDLRRGEAVVVADTASDSRTADFAAVLEAAGVRSFINLPLIEHGHLVAMFFVNDRVPRSWTADEVGFMRSVADRTRSAIERRRAENALRDLAASLERQVAERTADRNRLWQLSTDIMLVARFDGTVVATNPAWALVLGRTEAELLGRNLFELVHPDDVGRSRDGLDALLAGSTLWRFDNRCRHRDGTYRWIAWATVPGEGVISAVGRDITAEREKTEALQAAEEALRQSQKMEAVGQLTGGLAHDFNNLLTGISGSLELLGTRVAQGRLKDASRYIEAAQGAAKRAGALTHRLLAFSRRQTLDPSPTDINRLVDGLEELIARTVGPAIEVRVIRQSDLWTALVDQNQLENALLNLCINARDAMPEGGRITIETANVFLDGRAAAERELPPGQYLSLCVTDTGTGMTPEVIARAFDPFFTTKPIGQGTGLGLSMIYGFARQSGGHVRIDSAPGRGTAMGLCFPRHAGRAGGQAGEAALSDAPHAEKGETVLVVDDEPTVRMLVAEVLEDLGYTAIEAADGAAGLKVLQSDARIDLLVTDMGLPGGMNGRQVADAARVARPGLKVLFITGYAENIAMGGHLDPGMHVLTKPFAMEALASRIRELIAST